ncbi:MAG TPA: hypothetical protein VF865_07490, partial [Acidobacteriaceae bacterium]
MASHALGTHGGLSGGRPGIGDLAEVAHMSFFAGAVEEGASGAEIGSMPDRDQLLLEHLPTVRYLARRIHERLPQH